MKLLRTDSALRSWIRVALFSCLTFLITLSAFAQTPPNGNTDIGMTPFGSYHGGSIDSVSLRGGNLNIHAQLFCYPQRGDKLRLCFFIRYNNKGYIGFLLPSGGPGSVPTYKWLWQGNGVEVARDGAMGLHNDTQSVPVLNFRIF